MVEQGQGNVWSAGPRVFAALVGALVLVVLFLLGLAYCAWPGAYNSDHLYCSAVCEDLRLGRPLTGWYLPGAPYLFPDMVCILPCQLLPGGVASEFLGFLFATFLGLLAAVAWLGRAVGLSPRQAFTAAASGVLLLTAVHLGITYEGRGTHLASPGSHFGIVPVGIALVALAVGLLRRGPRPLPIALFLVFGALGGFSDKLLLVQFLAPLAAAVVLLAVARVVGVRAAVGLLALAGGAVLLSSGLRALAPRLGFHLLYIENTFGKVNRGDARALLGQVQGGVREQTLLAIFMVLYLPAAFLVVGAWLRRRADQPAGAAEVDRQGVLVAALALALAPLCNLAAVYAAAQSRNPAIYRYILPCYALPLLLTGWLLGLLPGRPAWLGRVVFPALAVLVAAWRMADRGRELATVKLETPYPPLAQVLDRLVRERGPLRGFAEFWTARRMHFLCREAAAIAPLDRYGMPFFHASRPGRFLEDDPRDASVPRYDFIVVRPACTFQDPGPELVSLLYGLPRERIPAGEHEVWLYDRLQSSPLDRFFRARIAERLRARDPGTGPASPGRLARPKANMSALNAKGTLSIPPDGEVVARFAHPLTGKAIDVAAGHDEVFDLEFRAGDRSLARLRVPGVPFNGSAYEYPGMQARLLPLPESVQTVSFDRVVVRPLPGAGAVHLGHLLVRAEAPPQTGIGPSQRRPHVRLEAEWLQTFTTFADDSLDASTRDPEASNGRVRQAAADFQGLVTYTPFLSLPAGRYRIDFRLRAGDAAAGEEVADIDVLCFGPPAGLAGRTLRGSDFPAGGFVTHSLTFDLAEDTDFLVFRLSSRGKTTIALDYLDVVALPADASSGQ